MGKTRLPGEARPWQCAAVEIGTTERIRRMWAGASLVALLAGCFGGQSGGDQDGTQGAICVEETHPFETAQLKAPGSPRPAAIARNFVRTLSERMVLQPQSEIAKRTPIVKTLLYFSEFQFGDTATVPSCDRFHVAVAFHVRSDDGAVDASFAGTLEGRATGEAKITAHFSGGHVDLAVGPERSTVDAGTGLDAGSMPPAADVTLEVTPPDVSSPDDESLRGTLRAGDGRVIGTLSNRAGGEPSSYTGSGRKLPIHHIETAQLPAVQRDVCKAVQPTASTTFRSDAAMLTALAKRWVVCSGESDRDVSFAGLVVDASGRYHELTATDDKLVAARGFEHEGQIAPPYPDMQWDGSVPQWQGFYMLSDLALSADGNTLRVKGKNNRLYDAGPIDLTFQATDLAIHEPALPFEPNTRAGIAACAKGEADVTARHAEAEIGARLHGRWLFCAGRFGLPPDYAGIAFRPDGSYRFLDAEGNALDSLAGMFQVDARYAQVVLRAPPWSYTLFPVFSRTPVKLAPQLDPFGTVLTGM
jgi:hypothetical protein